MKPKAIALCRVSTQGQANDGNLVPQEQNVRKSADILEADLVRIWSLAVSSRKGKNLKRKDLHEMRDFCKRYKSVKYLIIDEADRFMRSIDEYYWWKVEFKVLGVQIRFTNNPLADPEDDRYIFDELVNAYRAEQSNNERIKKTPDKQKSKILAGYYPSNPHTGYRKSDIPSLHEPDEPNWTAMQRAFRAMAAGEINIQDGLKQATEDGLRTRNYGPRAVGGRKIDMNRWKGLMVDPYYYGRLIFADWDLPENLIGLHKPMITKAEHDILLQVVKNKGKLFTPVINNPEFVLSNVAECQACLESGCKYPRLVGFMQGNGKGRYYKRYRCRCKECGCKLGMRQESLHGLVSAELCKLNLSSQQQHKLKDSLRKVWRTHEKTLIERAFIADGKVAVLKDRKAKMLDSLAESPTLKDDIEERITAIKLEIVEAEKVAAEAHDFEKDFDEFISFAFGFMDSKDEEWWDLDKQTLKVYKQIIFPGGIQVTPDRKVYNPVPSPIYTFKKQKTPQNEAVLADIGHSGGPSGTRTHDTLLKRQVL